MDIISSLLEVFPSTLTWNVVLASDGYPRHCKATQKWYLSPGFISQIYLRKILCKQKQQVCSGLIQEVSFNKTYRCILRVGARLQVVLLNGKIVNNATHSHAKLWKWYIYSVCCFVTTVKVFATYRISRIGVPGVDPDSDFLCQCNAYLVFQSDYKRIAV